MTRRPARTSSVRGSRRAGRGVAHARGHGAMAALAISVAWERDERTRWAALRGRPAGCGGVAWTGSEAQKSAGRMQTVPTISVCAVGSHGLGRQIQAAFEGCFYLLRKRNF